MIRQALYRLIWRPKRTGSAHAEGAARVAARDAGWAELLSMDGTRHLGRGHLMIFSSDPGDAGDGTVELEVDEMAAQPLGSDGPNLRAELRSFSPGVEPVEAGQELLVRPEHQQESFPVRVGSVTAPSEGEMHGLVELDWPDDELPTSLTELGGY